MPQTDRPDIADRKRLILQAALDFWGGPAHSVRIEEVVPGVYDVETPGHGGFIVDEKVFPLHQMAFTLTGRRNRVDLHGPMGYTSSLVGFEEDCDWAVLLWLHTDLIPVMAKRWMSTAGVLQEHVIRTVEAWKPETKELYHLGGKPTGNGYATPTA